MYFSKIVNRESTKFKKRFSRSIYNQIVKENDIFEGKKVGRCLLITTSLSLFNFEQEC